MIRPELIDAARDFELEMTAIRNANEKNPEKAYSVMAHHMSETLLKLGFYRGTMIFRSVERELKKKKEER